MALLAGGAGMGVFCSSCSLDIDSKDVGTTAAGIVVVAPSPEVAITSPQRATFHATGQVTVEGTVSAVDSSAPIYDVLVEGQVVPLKPDNTFEATITLDRGLNIVTASVTDARGASNSTQIGLLAGEWAPTTQPVDGALALRLNDSALDAISSILEPIAQTIDLAALTVDPIYDGNLWGIIGATVLLENPSLTVGSASIDAEVDGLHLSVEALNPYVEVKADARVIGSLPTERATVNADKAIISGRLELVRTPDDKLRVDIHDISVDFQNFRVQWNTGTIMPLILPLLRGWIEDKLEDLLVNEITDLQTDLHTSIADVLNPAVPTQILGKDFLYDVRVESLAHEATGVGVVFKFDAPPLTVTARGQAAPGSFHTPALVPVTATTQRGVAVSINDDLLNRALHTAWAAGLLEHDLASIDLSTGASPTGTTASGSTASGSGGGLALGSGGGGLKAGDLALFMPEILAVVDADDPLSARIDVGLPPVFEVTGAPDLATLSVGEAYLTLFVDRGSGPEKLLTVALHLKAGVTVAMVQGQGLVLSSNRNAEIGVDLIEQPLVRIDERKLQVVLGTALTPIIPRLINQVGLIPVPPQVSHLTFFDLQAFADGPSGEHLKVEVDMIR